MAVRNAAKCLQTFSKTRNEGIKTREREREREREGGRGEEKIQFYED